MVFQIKELQDNYNIITQEFESFKGFNSEEIEKLEKKYLGKNGTVTELLSKIKDLPNDQKASYGKEVNQLKQYVADKIAQLRISSENEVNVTNAIDPTAPFDINTPADKKPKLLDTVGSRNPLYKEMDYILDIFRTMGFDVEDCRELDNDYNMFEALNIPKGHPARDQWDTFFTDENLIPPAHTSTMQNRILKKYKVPIRVVIPGRCFRNEATDARHEHTLHQVEGVYVDEGITMGDMLGTIKEYLTAFFGKELQVKSKPGFFPFTEPSAEFVIGCPFCNMSGCSVCGGRGWMEIMGCGMIHPKVLREGGIDPEKYSGFAWGFGLDRLVMIKNHVQDIRRFQSGDIEFLEQF